MEPKRSTAQSLRTPSVIPLKGPHSVIGFIPIGAVNPETHLIALEVVLTFSDTCITSVPVHISQGEFEHHARVAHPTHVVADLRQWLVERARQQLAEGQPEVRTQPILRSEIYWMYGRPARREPFLL
jgi:hypothetical protein